MRGRENWGIDTKVDVTGTDVNRIKGEKNMIISRETQTECDKS